MRHSLLLALPLLLAPAASAGGLDASRVPADVTALAHVDVAGLQKGGLWQLLKDHVETDGLDEVRTRFGIDPLQDVRSVTVWDTSGKGERKAALLVTSAGIDTALERLQSEPSHHAVETEHLRVDAWGEGSDTVYAFVRSTGADERLVLLSDDVDALVGGVRVLLGQAPSLAATPSSPLAERPSPGSIVFAAAVQPSDPGAWGEQASAVLGLARSAVVDVGESRESLFVHAIVHTRDLDDAQNLTDILEGLRALGRLALNGGEDVPSELSRWLGAIQVVGRADEVQIALELSMQDLGGLIERSAPKGSAR